jgi:hypothetical protein
MPTDDSRARPPTWRPLPEPGDADAGSSTRERGIAVGATGERPRRAPRLRRAEVRRGAERHADLLGRVVKVHRDVEQLLTATLVEHVAVIGGEDLRVVA